MTHPPRPVAPDAPVVRRRIDPVTLAVWAAAAVVGVVLLGLALRLTHPGVLPGVTVAGIDAAGMSEDELAGELAPVADAAETTPVTFTHEDAVYEVAPDAVGYAADVPATVDAAMAPGRDAGFLRDTWVHVAATWRHIEVPLADAVDRDALRDEVELVASEADRDVSLGAIEVDPATLTVSAVPPVAGVTTDQERTVRLARAAFTAPGRERLALPVEVQEPRLTAEQVEAVAETARRALGVAFTAVLPSHEAQVVLEPSSLATLLTLDVEDDEARLGIIPDSLEELFAGQVGELRLDPVDASWDLPRSPAVTLDAKGDVSFSPVAVDAPVVPATPGREFDPEVVADQLAAALGEGLSETVIGLPEIEPDFTTEEAEAYGITELIGTFTTYHAPGQPRVVNIQKLADVIDGTRVDDGQQFSINQLSGERTCAKGYRTDAMILNGRLVDVCGGGVSQFGTTMLNAAFFSALPIDQYKAHSHYIGRYPPGREATLNYPSPDIDVRWTNDTGHGIVVRTGYTSTSITVSIYGTSTAASVSAIHGPRTNHRAAGVEYVEDPSLPPGSSKIVESPVDGFDITVTRVIDRRDGGEDRETFQTRYVVVNRIIHRNSQPVPEPSPTPRSSPTESDSGSDDPSTAGGATSAEQGD